MRGTFVVNNPDAVEVTLRLTMPVKQWKELNAQLVHAWPSWDLSRLINDLTRQVETQLHAKTEPKDGT